MTTAKNIHFPSGLPLVPYFFVEIPLQTARTDKDFSTLIKRVYLNSSPFKEKKAAAGYRKIKKEAVVYMFGRLSWLLGEM